MTVNPGILLLNLRIVGLMMAGLAVLNLFVPQTVPLEGGNGAAVPAQSPDLPGPQRLSHRWSSWMFSALLLAFGRDLLEPTRLARAVLAGLTGFWVLRMLMQWFFYSSEIWRGDRFKTIMHGVFSVAWVYVSAVFATALWISLATAASTP